MKSVLSEVLIKNPFDATLVLLSIFVYLHSKSKMAAKMARKYVTGHNSVMDEAFWLKFYPCVQEDSIDLKIVFYVHLKNPRWPPKWRENVTGHNLVIDEAIWLRF